MHNLQCYTVNEALKEVLLCHGLARGYSYLFEMDISTGAEGLGRFVAANALIAHPNTYFVD